MSAPTRISLPALTLAMTLAMIGAVTPGFAETSSPAAQADQDHEAHHPAAGAKASPPTGRGAAKSDQMPMGKTGGGGRAAMMNGDTKQMMSMMRNMMAMMSAQTGMMSPNVEGRIASLKTDLKITDAQAPQWERFAEALRAAARSLNGMYQQMMQPDATAPLPARLDRQEKMLSGHLASVKALKETLGLLYSSFNDEQKKVADGTMIGPMGTM